jgi:hypothetical protein
MSSADAVGSTGLPTPASAMSICSSDGARRAAAARVVLSTMTVVVDDDGRDPGMLDDETVARLGKGEVERQVGATRGQCCKHRHRHRNAVRQGDADGCAAVTGYGHAARQRNSLFVEFAKADPAVAVVERDLIAVGGGRIGEEVEDGAIDCGFGEPTEHVTRCGAIVRRRGSVSISVLIGRHGYCMSIFAGSPALPRALSVNQYYFSDSEALIRTCVMTTLDMALCTG